MDPMAEKKKLIGAKQRETKGQMYADGYNLGYAEGYKNGCFTMQKRIMSRVRRLILENKDRSLGDAYPEIEKEAWT